MSVTCTPDFCDAHDYPVAAGAGWCRRIDALEAGSRQRGDSLGGLSAVVEQLADVVERLSRNLPQDRPARPPQAERRTVRKGGVPT